MKHKSLITIMACFSLLWSMKVEAQEIQVENFSAQSGTSTQSANSGYTGTGYVDYGGNNSFVEWNVMLSGTSANFTFRYANGSNDNRTCDLIINGNNLGKVNFNGSGGWSTWVNTSFTNAAIANGNNTIRLVANNSFSGGPNLDRMNIVTSGSGGGNAENPTVSITSPSNGQNFTLGSTINITANASDNGRIEKVTFWRVTNGTFFWLSNDREAPYTFSASNFPSGKHTIRARATDNLGNASVDDTVEITIGGDGGGDSQAPTTPTGLRASSITSNSFKLTWNPSSDSQGAVAGYTVFLDGTTYGNANDNDRTISGLSPGRTYSVAVRAFDTDNNFSALSTTISVRTTGGGGGGNAVYNRVRKLGVNLNYAYWSDKQDGQDWTGSTKFRAPNLNFATETNPWSAEYLEMIKIYQVLRFMNWTGGGNYIPGNNPEPPVTNWGDNPRKGDLIQGTPTSGRVLYDQGGGRKTYGIAYEWMIDLCNRNKSDMWTNVPHAAVDPKDFPNGDDFRNEYVHKMAIMLKHGVDMRSVNLKNAVGGKNNLNQLANKSKQWFIDRGGVNTGPGLDPDLKIYVEYSNELWLRGQNKYSREKAQQLGFGQSHYRFGAWADIRVWKAYNDIFGANSNRIIRLGGHDTFYIESVANNHFNDVYENPRHNPWNLKMDAWNLNSYINPGAQDPSSPADVCGNANNSTLDERWTREGNYKAGLVRNLRRLLASKGINSAVSYEGGHHFECNTGEFSRNPYSYELSWEWADIYNKSNVYDLTCYFSDEGKWDPNGTPRSGSWGAKESSRQPLSQAHKYRGIKAWVDGVTLNDLRPKSFAPDLKEESQFILYPNPSKGDVEIVLEDNVKGFEVTIKSGTGSIVHEEKVNGNKTYIKNDLSSGLYFITINNGKIKETKKLIVQ